MCPLECTVCGQSFAERGQRDSEIPVGAGVAGIDGDQPLEDLHGFGGLPSSQQHLTEIVQGSPVVGIELESGPIVGFRIGQVVLPLRCETQIEMGITARGILGEDALQSATGCDDIAALEEDRCAMSLP
jgi:hypothetical protein